MGWRRSALSVIAVVMLLLGALLGYSLLVYKPVPVDPDWAISGDSDIPPDAVTVRFTGTSTLLFSDGETSWMVDGWFSRPGPLRLLFGEIGPDLAAIDEGLAANEVTTLAAVFPVHSHYDHAMDAPEVARRTGAMLLGSEATANIGRGWGLPESQIQVVEDRVPLQIGQFVITPIESRHFQFPDPAVRERALANTEILEPLVPPVSVFDYRLGKAYVLHVVHPRGSLLIVGSAGYKEGGLTGLSADVLFLGIGGLGSQTQEYVETYWRETVMAVNPSRLIPIHYDGLTAPITGTFRGPVTAMAFLARGSEKILPFLQRKEANNRQLTFQTLPRYGEVILFR
jgi:L-ascorbate metabolism protein UlaG (beta-lactamase superfamily)